MTIRRPPEEALPGAIALSIIATASQMDIFTPFQLLASVAVPHLLLSHWLERRLIPAPLFQERTAIP
ncbi:hypothetical protein [Sphingomonas radiodurans]|uniref:hypothetical protein n=1 Tax=Sphingomonas radiodurans TaxID=2890321 RepID=UPI001E4658F7|nr:hypothetical protein [Sphingomonas radiodurans]WBH15122.1 hypothetical protein LLW23_09620 [Sphingomonas radiodurans]